MTEGEADRWAEEIDQLITRLHDSKTARQEDIGALVVGAMLGRRLLAIDSQLRDIYSRLEDIARTLKDFNPELIE